MGVPQVLGDLTVLARGGLAFARPRKSGGDSLVARLGRVRNRCGGDGRKLQIIETSTADVKPEFLQPLTRKKGFISATETAGDTSQFVDAGVAVAEFK